MARILLASKPPSFFPFQSLNHKPRHSFLLSSYITTTHNNNNNPAIRFPSFHLRAFESSSSENQKETDKEKEVIESGDGAVSSFTNNNNKFPSGEFEMEEFGLWRNFVVKLRMLIAPPWQRVRKNSVLSMKLQGDISDEIKTRFSSGLSLPQICENFIKAAYDPRINGIYLQIDPLSCGWAKVEEIRRHILYFKKSGKFIVSYMPICGEKEYYIACACEESYIPPSAYISLLGLTVQQAFLRGVLEKIGVEPEVERIGKYKSAGDQLARKNLSEEVREMLTLILDNTYSNWLDVVSSTQGKSREEVEEFLNEGVYKVERLKEEGWITNLLYDDEITSMLKERIGQKDKKSLRTVNYKKYSKVRKWTVGLEAGGKDKIAVIRASGSISRTKGPFSSGIVADQFIDKIRKVRESDQYKAVILRIDSPGGDALASDLMWREIKLLAEKTPVIASMVDLAASGGYYMAMAGSVIIAENLTLTGSIGVVTGRFSLEKLYERIGYNKELISRGKFAEFRAADNRSLRPDEAELFAKSARNSYESFRNKAAFSRSMNEDQMEKVAQGRVWSGKDAALRGLVDSIGGFSHALAIAKFKANIPQNQKVRLVEISKPNPSLPELITSIGSSLIGLENLTKNIFSEKSAFSGVQAKMDEISFEGLGNSISENQILSLIKDFLRSI